MRPGGGGGSAPVRTATRRTTHDAHPEAGRHAGSALGPRPVRSRLRKQQQRQAAGGVKSSAGQKIPQGKQGGELTVLSAGDVDYMDPGQMYYTFGYMIGYSVNRPLYSFKPDNAEKPVSGHRRGDPQISTDKKTITVKIKTGIKFSPPVNREVTTKDIKYAMERVFSANVPNPYATGYFGDDRGRAEDAGQGHPETSRASRRRTTRRSSSSSPSRRPRTVAAALVMPLTMPVPEEYAKKFDAKNPSTYNQNVVFTGPYMVKNDATGKLTGWKPAKSIELVRNPNWDKSTDYRPGLPGQDPHRRGQLRLDRREPPDPQRLGPGPGRRRPAGPGAQAGRDAVQEPARARPRGRHALRRDEHQDQAVRQRQRAQGRRRDLRSQRDAPHAGGPIVGDIAWRYCRRASRDSTRPAD